MKNKGTLYHENGRVIYEGEHKYGKPHGQGTEYYPDGTMYEGEWKGGKPIRKNLFWERTKLFFISMKSKLQKWKKRKGKEK